MRCKLIKTHETEIKRYCEENGLSYSKLIMSILSWDNEEVTVFDSTSNPDRENLGLRDAIPMPVVLEIYLENGKLRFEQTDITRKYLGAEEFCAVAEDSGVCYTPAPAAVG
jgi:hypothetical protein